MNYLKIGYNNIKMKVINQVLMGLMIGSIIPIIIVSTVGCKDKHENQAKNNRLGFKWYCSSKNPKIIEN